MGNNKYEYRGLLAKTWDFSRGNTSDSPDTSFYEVLIKESGQPVLIVGCGTGRLPLEYFENGMDDDGLDISHEMIEVFRQKADENSMAINIFEQPMEEMKLPRNYNTIVVPSSSFQLVTDLEKAKVALLAFHDHLLPGGLLVISIWSIPIKASDDKWGDWWQVIDKKGFEDAKTVKRWERSKFDAETQLRSTQNRFEIWHGDVLIKNEEYTQQPELRSYGVEELSRMLEQSEFVKVRATSEFSDEPATSKDQVFCLLANRPN